MNGGSIYPTTILLLAVWLPLSNPVPWNKGQLNPLPWKSGELSPISGKRWG